MQQKIESEPSKRRLSQRSLAAAAMVAAVVVSPTALAQQETETSPIVQELTVTASVQPSCAFWLDRNWMSLGVYEGDSIVSQSNMNMRCSVLPSGLDQENFAAGCWDVGRHYQVGDDPNSRVSPRTMLLLNGDPNNPHHRLNYNIFDDIVAPDFENADSAVGASASICSSVVPAGALHPGYSWGWQVGPTGSEEEQPDVTSSKPIYIRIYPSDEQPGTPVPGNYSDTVTVYFVFKEPEAP